MRNPAVLARIDEWCDAVLAHLHQTIPHTVGLERGQYDLQIVRYGHDAVLGPAEPHRHDHALPDSKGVHIITPFG